MVALSPRQTVMNGFTTQNETIVFKGEMLFEGTVRGEMGGMAGITGGMNAARTPVRCAPLGRAGEHMMDESQAMRARDG